MIHSFEKLRQKDEKNSQVCLKYPIWLQSMSRADRRVFSCEMCGKEYTRQSSVKRHMRTHSGETVWMWGVQQNLYAQRSSGRAQKNTHWRTALWVWSVWAEIFRPKQHAESPRHAPCCLGTPRCGFVVFGFWRRVRCLLCVWPLL